jgi:hypothetical protein
MERDDRQCDREQSQCAAFHVVSFDFLLHVPDDARHAGFHVVEVVTVEEPLAGVVG